MILHEENGLAQLVQPVKLTFMARREATLGFLYTTVS